MQTCLPQILATVVLLGLQLKAVAAVLPPIPPMTSGDPNNPGMKHALVSLDTVTNTLAVHIDTPPRGPVVMMSGHDIDYAAPFDVLEGAFFNSQYGWLPDGLLVPPSGSDVWIRRTGLTGPAGATLRVYEGGRGNTMPTWSMTEIHTAQSAPWRWDRVMQHDVYVADKLGHYTMSFEVYLGDAATAEPLAGFVPATAEFEFVAVPEPVSLVGAGLMALFARAATRRY